MCVFTSYTEKIPEGENAMKAFAMLGLDRVGWIEKPRPECGPLDAIVRPIAVSPCTSDVHTVFEGALGDRRDMILGHEAVGEVVEVGALVRDFRPGDRVIVTAITPDWGSLEAQAGYSMHSGGMLAGWKFSNFKDGVFAEFFHVNEADANLARLPEGVEPASAVMLLLSDHATLWLAESTMLAQSAPTSIFLRICSIFTPPFTIFTPFPHPGEQAR